MSDAAAASAFAPAQQSLPLAVVRGRPLTELPDDLFIPPDALDVVLEAFEGPLDLLLYLIRRHKMDILDLKVNEITRQYLTYIDLMQELRIDLASEYLVMAAFLTEVKSRLLLPRPAAASSDEEADPRLALMKRLQTYEIFRRAALDLDELPREGRDFYAAAAQVDSSVVPVKILPPVLLQEVVTAFADVLKRASHFSHHRIGREQLSTRARMAAILEKVGSSYLPFDALFEVEEGRAGVVVTFLAILELVRESLLDLVQNEPFSLIHVRARAGRDQAEDVLPAEVALG